jgi:hypothetical protein
MSWDSYLTSRRDGSENAVSSQSLSKNLFYHFFTVTLEYHLSRDNELAIKVAK